MDDWKAVHAAMAHHPWVSPHKPPTLIRLTTLTQTSVRIAGGNEGWFSVRVYSFSLCLKRPTTRQQENARAPLATQRKNSLGAQHAPRGGGVGLVHLEVNSNHQHTGALSVPMCLPKLPSRAEKSFQAFKLSDNKPRIGRRHRVPGSAAKKSFWVFITLR